MRNKFKLKQKGKIIGLVALLILFNLFLLPGNVLAQDSQYQFTEEVKKEELSNGITVLVRENQAIDIVSLATVSNIGSKNDPEEKAGISYLTQKMLLEGTDNRSSREIDMDIESLGINLSPNTSHEYSQLTLKTTTDNFSEGLDIYFDLWKNSTFPQNNLDTEKNHAREQIESRKDEPVNEAVYNFLELYYEDHPFGKPVPGSKKGHENIEPQDLKTWFNQIYNPEELVISVVGNIDEEELISTLEEKIGDWSPEQTEDPELEPKKPEFEPPQEAKTETVERFTDASWLIMGYGAPSALDEDSAALSVLNSVLGVGMSSRLFRNVRGKQGLAYSVGSSYESFYGPSVFITYVGTRLAQMDKAKSEIIKEMERFTEEQVSESELEKAREYMKGQFLIGNESSMNQAVSMGVFETTERGYNWLDKYPEIIDDVNPEEIQKVATEYFQGPLIESKVLEKSNDLPGF
ncbi:MAG: M16 family metallopeptidase [Bacillota bacterium]